MRRLMFVAWLLAAAPLGAQVRIAPPEPLLASPGAERPVELQAAAVAVERVGGVARTTIELTLHNPSSRPLEGQLAFPLRDGQQVAGFALDVDGAMHEAVPVPKARGREVFEAIERRGVDPALLERTEGNHFRLRVFPVPPQGERRVRLELIESLDADADGWRLSLPLAFAAGLARVPLHVAGEPPTALAGDGRGAIRFAPVDGGVAAELGTRQLGAAAGVVLRWPKADAIEVHTGESDGDVWFVADVPLRDERAPRRLPAKIGLLWDASASAGGRDRELEFALLDRVFAAADVDVELHVLRDRATPPRRFRVAGGDWNALKAALRGTVYDGATDLGAWTPSADVGEYLLVSDGLANYGDGDFPALAPAQRLFAVSSAGAAADPARLRALAEARGGWLVELRGVAGIAAAAADLLGERTRVVAIDAPGAADVVAASPFVEDGRVRVGGRLTGDRADVALHVAGTDGVRRTHRVPVTASSPRASRFPGQIVAGWRLRALQADPDGNRTAIRMLGQRFGLVTAETSLLVLESLDDYLAYDIAPPAPWRAEFDARRRSTAADRDRERRENLDEVAAAFALRQLWWETDFSKARHDGKDDASEAAGEPMVVAAPSPVAPPPPSPMPMPTDAAPVADATASADLAEAAAAPPAGAADAPAQVERRARIAAEEAESAELDRIEVTGSRLADAGPAAADDDAPATTIAVQAWEPESDFGRRLRAAPADRVYALYLDERNAHADSPAFLLDVADILFAKGRRDEALRVLSNLAEMQLENRALLRVLGYRLMQADAAALAVPVFARVRELADEEPQSHRDLGLALDAAGRPQEAIDALWEVVARPWDGRFGGIALIALAELNAIVARERGRLDTTAFDARLLRNLPVGLRAVLTWDADATDMDLWVVQPDGEEVGYENPDSVAGGHLSEDFTGGYGPEEYTIRRARDGVYRIEVDHYGSDSALVTGAVTVQVWLSSGFGTRDQRDQRLLVRLQPGSDRLLVGEFTVR